MSAHPQHCEAKKVPQNLDGRLAKPLPLERTWTDDHDAQLAALRIVLGMPKQVVRFSEETR